MFEFLQPKGPLDPKVYWIRRGIVLGVFVLLIALLLFFFWPKGSATVSGDSSSATSDTDIYSLLYDSATPSASDSMAATASSTPTATSTATPTPTPTQPELSACQADSVSLSFSGISSRKLNAPITVKMAYKNISQAPCLLTLTKENYKFQVVSGSDLIFDSAHCGDWLPDVKDFKLDAGATKEVEFTWPGKRSTQSNGCNFASRDLRSGYYRFQGSFEGKHNFDRGFQMSA